MSKHKALSSRNPIEAVNDLAMLSTTRQKSLVLLNALQHHLEQSHILS